MKEKELLKETNLRSALKKEPINKLKDILKLYDKNWLSDFYYVITKKEVEDSKQSLINKIYDELTDEKVIHGFLNTLTENEHKELARIIENNGELQDDYIKYNDYLYLKLFGIVYTFNHQNKLHIIIPVEIMDIIKNMSFSAYHEKAIENTKLVNLVYSMLNLYGAVPLNIFLDYCCKYYNYNGYEDVDLDCIFMPERQISIKGIETDNNIYMIKEEYFDDYYRAVITKVISRIEDDLFSFDFKDIALEDLLKYKDLYYYEETDAVLEFKEYLRANNMTDENIDLLIGALVSTFRKDYNEGILFLNEMFEDEKYEINEENIDEIMPYINNIIDNISIWGNNGWTNKEIILRKCYE